MSIQPPDFSKEIDTIANYIEKLKNVKTNWGAVSWLTGGKKELQGLQDAVKQFQEHLNNYEPSTSQEDRKVADMLKSSTIMINRGLNSLSASSLSKTQKTVLSYLGFSFLPDTKIDVDRINTKIEKITQIIKPFSLEELEALASSPEEEKNIDSFGVELDGCWKIIKKEVSGNTQGLVSWIVDHISFWSTKPTESTSYQLKQVITENDKLITKLYNIKIEGENVVLTPEGAESSKREIPLSKFYGEFKPDLKLDSRIKALLAQIKVTSITPVREMTQTELEEVKAHLMKRYNQVIKTTSSTVQWAGASVITSKLEAVLKKGNSWSALQQEFSEFIEWLESASKLSWKSDQEIVSNLKIEISDYIKKKNEELIK